MEVQGLVVVELQAEGCAQMAGELEAGGGGLDLYVWSDLSPSSASSVKNREQEA